MTNINLDKFVNNNKCRAVTDKNLILIEICTILKKNLTKKNLNLFFQTQNKKNHIWNYPKCLEKKIINIDHFLRLLYKGKKSKKS